MANNNLDKSMARTDILRESVIILIFRLLVLMILTDGISLAIRFLFFDLNLHFTLGIYITVIYFVIAAFLYIIQIILILTVVLRWIDNYYYLEGDQLVHVKGIFTKKEHIIDLKNVKSVRVSQGILGNLFGYGTITLEIVLLGTKEEIQLPNIPQPHEVEAMIRKYI